MNAKNDAVLVKPGILGPVYQWDLFSDYRTLGKQRLTSSNN